MAPRTPDETRSLILDTALAQFAEHGFDGTSIRRIAEAAGISLGLLYHYFPSKEAVLQELFQRSIFLIQGCFMEAMLEAYPRRRIERVIQVALQTMQDQQQFYRVSNGVRMQPKVLEALGEGIAQWNAVLQMQWTQLLEEAGVEEPTLRATFLIASLDGLCQHYVLAPEGYPLQALGRLLIRDLLTDPTPTPQGAT